MRKAIVVLSVMLLFVYSCARQYEYSKVIEVDPQGWTYADTLDFAFAVQDTASRYNLYLTIEHADTFAWQNLYANLSTRFPNGKRLSKPIAFDLFDLRGAPNGTCSGGQCTLDAVLQENARFDQPGDYVLTVEQYMRKNSIPGISSVRFTLEKQTE